MDSHRLSVKWVSMKKPFQKGLCQVTQGHCLKGHLSVRGVIHLEVKRWLFEFFEALALGKPRGLTQCTSRRFTRGH